MVDDHDLRDEEFAPHIICPFFGFGGCRTGNKSVGSGGMLL